MTLSKSFLFDFVGIIIFKFLLDYSYENFLTTTYAYAGFVLDFNGIKYFEGWFIFFLLFFLLNLKKENVLYMTLLLSFLLLITPTVTLYSFKNESSYSFYGMMIPYAAMLLLISHKKFKIKYIHNSRLFILIIAFLTTLLVLLHYVSIVGLGSINFDLSKVYDMREHFGQASESGIFGYINSWTVKIFNISLIAWAIYQKKYYLLFIFIGLQILLFGYSGHKATLFSIFLLIALYIFNKTKQPSTIIIYSFISLVSFLLIYYFTTQEMMLPSILLRRSFFVPAHLNYIYFEYFSNHEYIYWSNSILKFFLNYPYDITVTHVVGRYLGDEEMAANTGIFGSGYMHLGIIGVFIYVFIVSLLINLINQFNRLPIWFINAVVLMPVLVVFSSSDLFTTLFTHGLLISILTLYMYSSKSVKVRLYNFKIKI